MIRKCVNALSLIKLAALVSLFSASTTAIGSDASISLSSDGISIQKENFGRLKFAYPLLITKSDAEQSVSTATVKGDSAELTYADGAHARVKILKGQIQIDFTEVPDDVGNTKLESTLGFTNLMGGKWTIGSKSGTFPTEKPADPFLFKGDADNFAITSPAGASISLKLPGVGWHQLQDNREWHTDAFGWFFKCYFDKANPKYTILVEGGSSEPAAIAPAAPANSGANASGPTPYPSSNAPAAWPGRGPIKSFDWMVNERKAFWSRREADQGKVVFVGDSIIGGWKLEKDFPGKPVANRGIGGDVSRGVLFRLQEDVLDLHPKAIVIEIGGNDNSADGKLADYLFNINAIIDLAQKTNPNTPIILCGMTPKGIPASGPKAASPGLAAFLNRVYPLIPSWNAELAKIASTRKNVSYVDFYTPLLLQDGSGIDVSLFADDQVHPTGPGHTKLAEALTKTLTDLKLF